MIKMPEIEEVEDVIKKIKNDKVRNITLFLYKIFEWIILFAVAFYLIAMVLKSFEKFLMIIGVL